MNSSEESPRTKETLDGFAKKAQHLLPAPHIVPQLLALLNRADINTNKIVELISYDPSLTANVMRICNSAYYNRGTPIVSLHHAVTHIGLNETYRIVVAITGSLLLGQAERKRSETEARKLWEHSVTVAMAAQILAQDMGEDQDIVFTAALLHDIGKIAFAAEEPGLYENRADAPDGPSRSLVEIEKEQFGFNHAELGGRLLEAWRFPTSLVAAVRFHHQLADAMTFQRITACVSLGDSFAYVLGRGYGRQEPPWQEREQASRILNLSAEDLSAYETDIQHRLKMLKDLYPSKA